LRISKEKLAIAQAKAMLDSKNLAKKANVSINSVLQVGKYNMQPVTVGKIAKALNVDVTEIIELEK
jgi:hypothetical protein